MTTFPGSPKLHKGAIIGIGLNPLASLIPFQYNPDTLSRSLSARTSDRGSKRDRAEAIRVAAPPQETISLQIELDATDQLERAEGNATKMGIYPALASLEMLLYPESAFVIANEVLLRTGIRLMIPPDTPMTLFVWGPKRVLPVRLDEFSITEQAFDTDLNPIRASVSLHLNVLSYEDLGLVSPGGAIFMAHQIAKEVMATINGVGRVASGADSFFASPGR